MAALVTLGYEMQDGPVKAEHYRNWAESAHVIAEEFLMSVATDYKMLARLMENSRVADPLPASE